MFGVLCAGHLLDLSLLMRRLRVPLIAAIRVDKRYLKPQPLPTNLIQALGNRDRVYIGGKLHRVKATGISDDGQIIGKLERLEVPKPI